MEGLPSDEETVTSTAAVGRIAFAVGIRHESAIAIDKTIQFGLNHDLQNMGAVILNQEGLESALLLCRFWPFINRSRWWVLRMRILST